jgi:cytochrome c oxidase subunit 2
MLNRLLGQVPNASQHGSAIDTMLEMCHWLMLVLFVGWSLYLVYTLIRFHKSNNPKANYHGVKSHFSSHIEFSVVLVEAILLLGFAYPLWARRVIDKPNPENKPVTVKVVAQQFLWYFRYPGADNQFGKTDSIYINSGNPLGADPNDPASKDDFIDNELHVPVDRDVILQITSKDVIHSFSLEAMRVGQDAIPGMVTPIWFHPVKTGEYEVICGQLCGTNHYNMRGVVKVDSEEDYKAYLKEKADQNGSGGAN